MNKLNSSKIAFLNIIHKPARSIGLMCLVTILSFVLFGGSILSLSLQNGLNCMENRLGADLIIVPNENESDMESILLQGTPSEFYFDISAVDKIKEIEGISAVTSQFFLKSLNASCCALPVQLIGFDPKTDFSVQPWINKVYNKEITTGSVIAGSDVFVDESSTIKIFGDTYNIVSTLEKTGTGLDQTLYVTTDTMLQMYESLLEKDSDFQTQINPTNSVSTILVKVDDNYNKKDVIKAIYRSIDNIEVIEPQNMVSTISNSLDNISVFINIFIILFFLLAFLTLYIVFSISANERKKEFAILRVLGATKNKLKTILLFEAFLISSMSGIIGIVIASCFIFPLSTYIGITLGLPYIHPSNIHIVKILLMDLIICGIVGPLASIHAAGKISKAETYITMREND